MDRKLLERARKLIKINVEKVAFCGNRMLYKLACGDEELTEEESECAYKELCVMEPDARKWPLKPAHLQFVAQGLREAGLTLMPQRIRPFMGAVAMRIESGEYDTIRAGDLARQVMDQLDVIIGPIAAMEPLLDVMFKVWLKLEAGKLTDIVESSRAHRAAMKRFMNDEKLRQKIVTIMSTYGEITDSNSAKLLATCMYNTTAKEFFKLHEDANRSLEALIEKVLQELNKD
ncbi:hypothetical protein UCDDS831_g02889 [Diplodia seriata]|uniref:Uncharacterized protein n=1 Tax=Diplodia seriata TaxID=420778 RepID=A0A0G2GJI5_9PEZI|nr:hypothetical protein UCDDS831_g02889 [Diplodia seriata]